MTIKVQIRSVYGRDTVYPACPDAARFASIAGTKTLCDHTLRMIRDLGYEIVIEHPAVYFAR